MSNTQKLSYHEALSMSRGDSWQSRQQKIIEKYGPQYSTNISGEKRAKNEITESTAVLEVDSVKNDKLEKQINVVEVKAQENSAIIKDVNPVKEFENIYAKYLTR